MKKGSWAQGEGKPRRKRGRKVQSPMFGTGVTGKQDKMNKSCFIDLFYNNCGFFFPLSSYLISVPFMMSVQLLVSIGVGLEGASQTTRNASYEKSSHCPTQAEGVPFGGVRMFLFDECSF